MSSKQRSAGSLLAPPRKRRKTREFRAIEARKLFVLIATRRQAACVPFPAVRFMTKFLNSEELEAGVEHILQSPKDDGILELIVRRPEVNKREVVEEAELDLELGLVGDNWKIRGSSRTNDGFGHPEMQLNLMNSRVASLVAQSKDRWKLAGDQLYIDLDLSRENLPPSTEISIGAAVIRVSEIPHTGCKKFVERFGLDAMKFVNSEFGRQHGFRGINAKVVQPGVICVGNSVRKV